MGRLGFNVGTSQHKDACKNVEAGLPDYQQNEKNESAEMSELLDSIEAKNKTISRLRGLSILLTCMFVVIMLLFLLTTPIKETGLDVDDRLVILNLVSEKFDLTPDQALFLKNYLNEPEASRYESQQQQQQQDASEKMRELLDEKTRLTEEVDKLRSRIEATIQEAEEKYNLLQDSYVALQTENEALERKENELNVEIKKLRDERTQLVEKIDVNERRIQQQRNSRQSVKTTTTTTTTAAPSRKLFDNDQLKKFNDLVRDIETGAALFDFKGFMKKTDDVLKL